MKIRYKVPENILGKIQNIETLADQSSSLSDNWEGLVFCHPHPYSYRAWVEKCINYKDCIVLLYNDSSSSLLQELVYKNAAGILFIKGRLRFNYLNGERAGNAPLASIIAAFSQSSWESLQQSGIKGTYIKINEDSCHFNH